MPDAAEPIDIAGLLASGGTLRLSGGGSDAWQRVNAASLGEYRDHHGAGNYPPAILEIMGMAEAFVGKWAGLWGARTMLDIGCGIGRDRPPYVRHLAGPMTYAGLDPFAENLERTYPFICGRLEDLAARPLNKKFDLALFATSLDHFEDARNALALAGSVTTGGHLVVWCGLHDSPLIARTDVSDWIFRLCRNNRTFLSRSVAFLFYALLTWPRIALTLWRRERRLAAGRPLDDLHFHYFTEARLRALLDQVGTVHEFALCPGCDSAFVALTVHPQPQ